MDKTVQVELVTPEKVFLYEEAAMVIVPGAEGDFAVLPRRAPMLSMLRPGVVTFFNEDDVILHRIFISSGAAEIINDRCTILTEEAINVKDIDRGAAAHQLKQARKDLKEAKTHAAQVECRLHIKYYDTIVKLMEQEERNPTT